MSETVERYDWRIAVGRTIEQLPSIEAFLNDSWEIVQMSWHTDATGPGWFCTLRRLAAIGQRITEEGEMVWELKFAWQRRAIDAFPGLPWPICRALGSHRIATRDALIDAVRNQPDISGIGKKGWTVIEQWLERAGGVGESSPAGSSDSGVGRE